MRNSLGPASRCVRSLDNRARPGDSDRKAGRRAVRTCAMKKAVRGVKESSEHPSPQPRGKRLTVRQSSRFDKKRFDKKQVATRSSASFLAFETWPYSAALAVSPKVPIPSLARVIARLIGKANRDSVVAERPEFLDQPILQLCGPLPCEKRDDLFPPV